jgi:type IV pilus assembly protein PilB
MEHERSTNLRDMPVRSLIGEKLVEKGIITREQLNEALLKHEIIRMRGEKELLGQILVELGYCTREDIARIVASQAGVRFVEMDYYSIDMSAAGLVPPEIALRYSAIPVGFDREKLLVAMKNPTDIIAIDDLRIVTGHSIEPIVINDEVLDSVLKRYASISMGVDEDFEEREEGKVTGAREYNEQPAVQLANQVINQAVKAGASDVHIEPQERQIRVRFRIDGVLHEILTQPINIHPPLVSRIKVMANMDIAERRIPQDGRISLRVNGDMIDVRVASMPSAYGEKITMRLLNRSDSFINSFTGLCLPDGNSNALSGGLFLVIAGLDLIFKFKMFPNSLRPIQGNLLRLYILNSFLSRIYLGKPLYFTLCCSIARHEIIKRCPVFTGLRMYYLVSAHPSV